METGRNDVPTVPSWFTRAETARMIERCPKTVDRLRKAGILADMDNKGMIRITRQSIEEYLRRPVEVQVEPAGFISIEQTHYDCMLRRIQHLEAEVQNTPAIIQELNAVRAENERLKKRIMELQLESAGHITVEKIHYDSLLHENQRLQIEVQKIPAIIQELEARRAATARLKKQNSEILADLANPLTLVRDILGRNVVLVKTDFDRDKPC